MLSGTGPTDRSRNWKTLLQTSLLNLREYRPRYFHRGCCFLISCCCHCCCRYSCSIYSNLPCLFGHIWHCLLVILTVNGDRINAVRRYVTNLLVVWTHFIHSLFSQVKTKRAVYVIELSLIPWISASQAIRALFKLQPLVVSLTFDTFFFVSVRVINFFVYDSHLSRAFSRWFILHIAQAQVFKKFTHDQDNGKLGNPAQVCSYI